MGCDGPSFIQGRMEYPKLSVAAYRVFDEMPERPFGDVGGFVDVPGLGTHGRVGSRRDPFDGQVSSVVDFAIPLLRRGARAFIVRVTGYPYLNLLSSLLLTIPLHLTMSSVVLATRRAPASKGCRHCPPYLCQVDRMITDPSMPASGRLPRVGSTTLAGQLSGGART
ncbi:hypothetical protein GW17_00053789 [Ensete ventricosum]|nr:hypothetical protein GW17_00053789 [Ensete ventricosum]